MCALLGKCFPSSSLPHSKQKTSTPARVNKEHSPDARSPSPSNGQLPRIRPARRSRLLLQETPGWKSRSRPVAQADSLTL
eukprot:9479393-Pyramimonas_sp.AAC.1